MIDAKHISKEKLERYYRGKMRGLEFSSIECHISGCSDCLGRLKAVARDVEAVRLMARMSGFDLLGAATDSYERLRNSLHCEH